MGLEKISSSSSYLGGGGVAISRFSGTPEKRHETCKKKNLKDMRKCEGNRKTIIIMKYVGNMKKLWKV